jgi:hypothetical protein
MTLAVHAVLLAGAALPAATAAQDGLRAEIRVTSAIYGAAQGSADVTPVVTRLVKPSPFSERAAGSCIHAQC